MRHNSVPISLAPTLVREAILFEHRTPDGVRPATSVLFHGHRWLHTFCVASQTFRGAWLGSYASNLPLTPICTCNMYIYIYTCVHVIPLYEGLVSVVMSILGNGMSVHLVVANNMATCSMDHAPPTIPSLLL